MQSTTSIHKGADETWSRFMLLMSMSSWLIMLVRRDSSSISSSAFSMSFLNGIFIVISSDRTLRLGTATEGIQLICGPLLYSFTYWGTTDICLFSLRLKLTRLAAWGLVATFDCIIMVFAGAFCVAMYRVASSEFAVRGSIPRVEITERMRRFSASSASNRSLFRAASSFLCSISCANAVFSSLFVSLLARSARSRTGLSHSFASSTPHTTVS